MREEIRKKLEEKKNFNWTVHNELETRDFGLELSSYLKPGDVLALERAFPVTGASGALDDGEPAFLDGDG